MEPPVTQVHADGVFACLDGIRDIMGHVDHTLVILGERRG